MRAGPHGWRYRDRPAGRQRFNAARKRNTELPEHHAQQATQQANEQLQKEDIEHLMHTEEMITMDTDTEVHSTDGGGTTPEYFHEPSSDPLTEEHHSPATTQRTLRSSKRTTNE